jgi:glycosyltransferase involved in cell wall biosynthesis
MDSNWDKVNKLPKVSVIMPVHNGERFIENSIESIINQTFKNLEFIIIDDKSTDNSLEIIKKYAARDRRIKIVINKSHLGITKSLNLGLKMARGRYIARMDADDISSRDRLEVQMSYLDNHKDVFMVCSNYIRIVNKSENKVRIDKLKVINIEKENFLIHSSIMFRNGSEFYRERFTYSQDYDFYLRLLTRNKKIIILPDFLVKYRKNKFSISNLKRKDKIFFDKKAIEFYYQRKVFGKDKYPSLRRKVSG